MSNEFIPLNKIERGLIEAKKGEITLPKLIDILISEKLFMPSVDIIGENGIGFSPLIFDRNGISMTAIFTDKSRIDKYKSKIKDVMIISFEDLLKNIPENYGIVINPGYLEGLELLPHGIKNIKRDFLAEKE